MKMQCKQRGIGLLELMLAMAIMAILIIVSIQYFQSTKNSTYMNAAVQEVQTIMATTNGLTNPKKIADANSNDLTKSIILSGSIPKTYIDGDAKDPRLTGPWGKGTDDGEFEVAYNAPAKATGNKAYATLTLSGANLPNYACESLVQQFTNADNVAQGGTGEPTAPSCDTVKGALTFTMNFYFATGKSISVKTSS